MYTERLHKDNYMSTRSRVNVHDFKLELIQEKGSVLIECEKFKQTLIILMHHLTSNDVTTAIEGVDTIKNFLQEEYEKIEKRGSIVTN